MFGYVKSALTAAPVLEFSNVNRGAPNFVMDTDASSHAVEAVLSQRDSNGRERVIAYGSRTLDKAERNYSTTRQKVSFTKKFAVYLRGKMFQIGTDHQALFRLQTFKESEGQLERWQEILADFDFDIVYRPGEKHAASYCHRQVRRASSLNCTKHWVTRNRIRWRKRSVKGFGFLTYGRTYSKQ